MDEQLTAASAARVGELLALLEPLGVPVGATSLSEIAQRIQQLSVAHEIWTHPQLRVLDDQVRLYADGAAYDADRPAREWRLG
jgi:hypothetical protein